MTNPKILWDSVSLVKRNDTWLISFRIEGEKYPRKHSTGCKLNQRNQAEQALEEWKDLQKKRSKPIVGELIDQYYDEKGRFKVTEKKIKIMIAHLKRHGVGNFRVKQLNKERGNEYRDKRYAEGVSPPTVRKELACLKAAIKFTTGKDIHIELPPHGEPRSQFLTEEQFDKLLAAASHVPHLYLFIVLAYTTTARPGAIFELTWDRVLWDEGEYGVVKYAIGPRTNKGRATVPLNQMARKALRDAYRVRQTDYVIEFHGHRVSRVKIGFDAARKRAGLPDWVTPYTLRHTSI